MTIADYFVELCRLHVLIAMLFAAAGKTFDFAAFRESLLESFPVWQRAHGVLASMILGAEWGIVVLMLAGGTAARTGIWAATGLFAVFTAVFVWALVNDRAIVCSCFGASGHRIGGIDLVRNLLLTTAAATVALWPSMAAPLPLIQQLILLAIASISIFISVWMRDVFWLLRAKAVG